MSHTRPSLPFLLLAGGGLLLGCNGPIPTIPPSPGASASTSLTTNKPSVAIDGHTVPVNVADTPDLRSTWPKTWPNGPAANGGILLDWGGGTVQKIWMYTVPVALDVLFVAGGKVIELDANQQPCPSQTGCNTLGPDTPIDYLVELPAGTAASWGIKVGDAISYTRVTSSSSPAPNGSVITPGPNATLITPAPATTPGATPSPAASAASVTTGGNPFIGSWIGIAGTIGQLTINADGTYSDNGTPQGRYTVNGNQITFLEGTMTAWNHGQAELDQYGTLKFYWTDDQGIHYFDFEKQ